MAEQFGLEDNLFFVKTFFFFREFVEESAGLAAAGGTARVPRRL